MKKITLLSISAFLLVVLSGAKGCFFVPEPLDGGNPDDTGTMEDPEDPAGTPSDDGDATNDPTGNDAEDDTNPSGEDVDPPAGEANSDTGTDVSGEGEEEAEVRAEGYIKLGDIKGESDSTPPSGPTDNGGSGEVEGDVVDSSVTLSEESADRNSENVETDWKVEEGDN